MPVTRRTALTILGGIAIGYGAVGASGAFDRVELLREVSVDLGGDQAGYLVLAPHSARDFSDENYGPEVDYDEQGLIYADFTNAAINEEGVTRFDDLIEATNQGSQTITLEATGVDKAGAPVDGVTVYANGDVTATTQTLTSGSTGGIGIEFDTRGTHSVNDLSNLRFLATSS